MKQHITTMVYYHATPQEASCTVCSTMLSDVTRYTAIRIMHYDVGSHFRLN